MPDYLVEIATMGREVYLVTADSPEAAKESWDKGHLVNSEVTSVEGVTSVRLEED